MVGTETLAMVMSSTTMKLPTASRKPARIRAPPRSGTGSLATYDAATAVLRGSAVGVDVDVHRQADAEGAPGELSGIEGDAHGQALDNLDPVAGGVLRRDH